VSPEEHLRIRQKSLEISHRYLVLGMHYEVEKREVL
jgi:hypothetical protein